MTFAAEIKASLSWTWDDGAVDDDRARFPAAVLRRQRRRPGRGRLAPRRPGPARRRESVALDLTALGRRILGDPIPSR